MDKLDHKKIAIIGVGHMGSAIAEGFLRRKAFRRQNIMLANPSPDAFQTFIKYGVVTTTSNREAACFADIVFLCVKPVIVPSVLKEIREEIKRKVLVSTAAGVTLEQLRKYTPHKQKIIRVMPNLPVAQHVGVVGWMANSQVGSTEKNDIEKLLATLGLVIEMKKEVDLDTLTVIAGSGPALVAYFLQAFIDNAVDRGFSKQNATDIAVQTFLGTLTQIKLNNISPGRLMQAVTTKGGITEAILQSFEKQLLSKRVDKGLQEGMRKLMRTQFY